MRLRCAFEFRERCPLWAAGTVSLLWAARAVVLMFVFSQFAVYVGYGPAVYGAERRSARSADRKAM